MKKQELEIHKLPDNDIPEDIRKKAALMAKAMFNTKPIANEELRKKYNRESKSEKSYERVAPYASQQHRTALSNFP